MSTLNRSCAAVRVCFAIVSFAILAPATAETPLQPPSVEPILEDSEAAAEASPSDALPSPILDPAMFTDAETLSMIEVTPRGSESIYFQQTVHEYGPNGYVRKDSGLGPTVPAYYSLRSSRRRAQHVIRHHNGRRKTLLQWGGFAHLDAAFDFDPIGSTSDFVTATIPVPQQTGQNVDFSPRASRLELKIQSDTEIGPITGFAQIDFFNGNTQGAFGSFPPRVRYFYADLGWLRFGQDATVFMDYSVYPNVVEYEGPAAMILMRQGLVRVTLPVGDKGKLAMAAEQPYSDIAFPTDAQGRPLGKRIQDAPDLTAHLRLDDQLGHLQISGVLRRLSYQSPAEITTRDLGYGLNLTGDLFLFASCVGGSPRPESCPSPCEKSRFLWQYAVGQGIARYIQDANGLGRDAALNSDGQLEALSARSWFVGYEHWWTHDLSSTFVFTDDTIAGLSTLPGNTYKSANYVAANLVWNVSQSMWVGGEYLWGNRTNLDGQTGRAKRIQLAARYNF